MNGSNATWSSQNRNLTTYTFVEIIFKELVYFSSFSSFSMFILRNIATGNSITKSTCSTHDIRQNKQ